MLNGRLRKAAGEASKTGWVYILDRITGKPLIGIDEKPVVQEPRQLTSPTPPFPRGDAFVPQEIDIAPEDYPLVNRGRIFTPFWTDGIVAKPSPRGGANWPPSSYDPASAAHIVVVVRKCREQASAFWRRVWRLTSARYRHLRRIGYEDKPSGVAAGMEGFLL